MINDTRDRKVKSTSNILSSITRQQSDLFFQKLQLALPDPLYENQSATYY